MPSQVVPGGFVGPRKSNAVTERLAHSRPEGLTVLLENFPPDRWHGKARQAAIKLQAGKIAVACSGGADSTFALLMIYAAFPQCCEESTLCISTIGLGPMRTKMKILSLIWPNTSDCPADLPPR